MRIAFIDLETTGLPRTTGYNGYYHYERTAMYDSSRIVQIAVIIYDIDEKNPTESKYVAEHTYIVKPDEFDILNSNIHGITQEMATFTGVPFGDIVNVILPDLKTCDSLVAHNILFDKNVLLSELHRYRFTEVIYMINRMGSFCTSEQCKSVTKIKCKSKNSKYYKQPKLSELYKFLMKKDMKNAHNALADTQALVECFLTMLKNQQLVIKDKKIWRA
jgi:DNA polymerase-3 subunit epsilon